MKYKVIFDTNSVRSAESFSDFLGGREELERFVTIADIVIPELVIEEIVSQKRKILTSKRDSFLSNPFRYLLSLDEREIVEFNMDQWIEKLSQEEQIPFKKINLTKDKSKILDEIKDLCINCKAPFEENSDKGFKDAYIYFTIREYISSCKDETIFIVTRDNRLKLALQSLDKVIVIENFDEFEKYNTNYFTDEYFISRLREEIDQNIKSKDIEKIYLNIEDNWVLKIVIVEQVYFVNVDFLSKEIISSTETDFSDTITNLISSSNFSSTHAYVSELLDNINYLSNQEITDLLVAATENDQIYWIASDEDVKSFFLTLYKSKSMLIPEDTRKIFEEHFLQND
jgi:hypothetical protein